MAKAIVVLVEDDLWRDNMPLLNLEGVVEVFPFDAKVEVGEVEEHNTIPIDDGSLDALAFRASDGKGRPGTWSFSTFFSED